MKNSDRKDRDRKKRKLWIWALAGTGLICFLMIWIIKVHFFKSEEPGLPVAKDKFNTYVNALIRPGQLNSAEKLAVVNTMANLPDAVRVPVIRLAARQGIEELRKKFKGITTPEEKQKKVDAIIAYIDEKYVINQDTDKVFNKEFLNEAIQVYVKEVPADERALYAPIVNKLISKINSKPR